MDTIRRYSILLVNVRSQLVKANKRGGKAGVE